MKRIKKAICVVLCLSIFAVFSLGSGDGPSSSSTTTTTTSSTTKSTCQFKNSDGTRTCTNEATHGQLCDYHFNMLNDTYNSMTQ